MARSWLSAQQQILRVFSHSVAGYNHGLPNGRYFGMSYGVNDHLPTQWQISVNHLLAVCDILNSRAGREGLPVWAADGHPPNGGCDHVHISHSSKFIFDDVAGAHASNPWGCHQLYGQDTHWQLKIYFYQLRNM